VARDGVGRAVVYESTLSRKRQRRHVYAACVRSIPSHPLQRPGNPLFLSICTWLPALLHPLTNIPLINLLTVRYRLIGRAGLRSPVSSLRPIDSTGSFDLAFTETRTRTFVKPWNLNFTSTKGSQTLRRRVETHARKFLSFSLFQ